MKEFRASKFVRFSCYTCIIYFFLFVILFVYLLIREINYTSIIHTIITVLLIVSSSLCLFWFIILAVINSKTHIRFNGNKAEIITFIKVKRKRKKSIFRFGDYELVRKNYEFNFSEIIRYGYVVDLDLEDFYKKPMGKGTLFHTIAFTLIDGTFCAFFCLCYSEKQLKEIIQILFNATNILPEGNLGKLL